MELEYLVNFTKISLIAFFGWIGLQIDVVPIALYSMIWVIESFTHLLKVLFLYRKVDFWEWIFRTVKHLSVLVIPLVIILMVKAAGQDFNSLYRSSILMITFYISITAIGNVISLFSNKEYNFEGVLIGWFERLLKWYESKFGSK